MAWTAQGNNLTMAEGDYGVSVPITIRGVTFDVQDSVKVTVKTAKNGTEIFHKDYSNVQDNTIQFSLTEAQSELLPVGQYVYVIDWYRDLVFMYNVLPAATLKVVDKG